MKQKRFIVVFFTMFIILAIHAQTTQWAKKIAGMGTDLATAICHDGQDNIYVAGSLKPTGQVDGHVIGVQGAQDAFVVKFSADGEFLWGARGGGDDEQTLNEGDEAMDIAYSSVSNAIYICGTYEGFPATFGNGIAFAGQGGFLAKYDAGDGECIWVRHTDKGNMISVSIEPDDDIIVTGGALGSSQDSVTFSGAEDRRIPVGGFAAKYDTDGEMVWAKKVGHNLQVRLSAHGERHVLLGIPFNEVVTADLLGSDISFSTPESVLAIAEVDDSFSTVQWMKTIYSSTRRILGWHTFVENGGHLLSGGYVDSLFLQTDTLVTAPGTYGTFLLRLDSLGTNEEWVMDLGGNTYRPGRFSTYEDGSTAVAIAFSDSIRFADHTLLASGSTNFAVARITPSGTLVGAFQHGEVTKSYLDVTVLSNGDIALATTFDFTVDLGDGYVLTGGADIAVARFGVITSAEARQAEGEGALLIYANPNQGTCSIELPPGLVTHSDLVLRIRDVQGRVVQESPLVINSTTIRLDIRAQATGTYIAEVGNATVRYTGRIVFE